MSNYSTYKVDNNFKWRYTLNWQILCYNQNIAIFENDSKKYYYYINQLNVSRIFVNKKPFNTTSILFEEAEFVHKKHIV